MKDTLLLIIDLQKNFINEFSLDLPYTIQELINSNKFKHIVFTKFINDENSSFYKILNYKGCMTEDDRNIVIDTKDYKVIEKMTYSALNEELQRYISNNNIKTIYLCGIDTDACVLKTALDLFENNYDVKVIEDCCMSHSGAEFRKYAIRILKKMIGNQNIIFKNIKH